MDAIARKKLAEALDLAADTQRFPCQFRFCPGADARYVPMATCHMCRMIQKLRQACRRLRMPIPISD